MSAMSELRRLRLARLHRQAHSPDYTKQGGNEKTPNKQGPTDETPRSDHETHNDTHHQNQPAQHQRRKPDEILANWTVAVAIFTGVLALASIVGDVFSYLALRAINGQLREMHDAGTDTKKIVEASDKQATAAVKQADAAIVQAQGIKDQIEGAKQTAIAARESSIAASRAWVGPSSATIDASPSIGKDAVIAISYQNSGREPAAGTLSYVEQFVVTVDENGNGNLNDMQERMQKCLSTTPTLGAQVVYPTTGFSGNQMTATISKNVIDADIISGKKVFGITGCFAYITFGQPHHSAFCFLYRSNMTKVPNLNYCAAGGWAD